MAIMCLDHVFKKKKKPRRSEGLPKEWTSHGYIGDSWKVWGKRLIDITNKTFWNLIVVERDRSKSSRAYSYWICECTCGCRYSIRSDRLRSGGVFACPPCTRKVNKVYQEVRDDQRTKEQIEKAVMKRMSLQIREGTSVAPSALYIPGHIYSRSSILQMRDEFQMKIGEIAKIVSLTPDEVRTIINKARGKGVEDSTSEAVNIPQRVAGAEPQFIDPSKSIFKVSEVVGLSAVELKRILDEEKKAKIEQAVEEEVKRRQEGRKKAKEELDRIYQDS